MKKLFLNIIGVAIFAFFASSVVFAQADGRGVGFMPMMQMMVGGWSSPFGNNLTNNMMNFGFGSFGGFGWIFMIFWWALIIAGIAALVRWLIGRSSGPRRREKSSLEILKERYARGEIGKKEFEDKKKDLI